MRLKISVIVLVLLSYLTITFGVDAATSLCSTKWLSICTGPDGTNPPHAVDITGKAIPESSATQPDKPIILAKDSTDPSKGEFIPAAAFDHTKHSTDARHSMDGKTITTCVECHHTAQPSAPAGQEYLKRFDRKEILTAMQLETSKEPVQSCRACHLQAASEETKEFPPASIRYPKKTGKQPTGKLTNEIAYHINCNSCHEAVLIRDPTTKAPQKCIDCHTIKK